ncbi:NADAR family protein [Actinoplanes sp. NPDC023936]|uniref:NADAR family protein n=1 Tax=Actinoplanes sp. NPDC023936 TaxID=3154910 RepID=UPI0033E09290
MSTETANAITEFRNEWAFLSNFHKAPLTWEGLHYPTSEHAFNAGKTTEADLRRWIAAANTPREAKRRGHQVRLRDHWDDEIRYQVMRAVLRAKFAPVPGRVQALLSTGSVDLVEGNTWHDMHWGKCTCSRHGGMGDNYLGRFLMDLRAELGGV